MHVNINGFPITLVDTAGLRTEATDIVEKEGILRAHAMLEKADLILLVIDTSKLIKHSLLQSNIETALENHIKNLNLDAKYEMLFNRSNENNLPKCICVFNKIDLLTEEQKITLKKITEINNKINCISCKTEEGFQLFLKELTKMLQKL